MHATIKQRGLTPSPWEFSDQLWKRMHCYDTRRLNQYAQQARWLCIFSYLNATVLHLATSQEKRNQAKGAAPKTKKVLLETGYKQSSPSLLRGDIVQQL